MKETRRAKALISEYFIFVIFIALVVVLTCLKPSFIQPANLVNILKQASINGILAFGMMFVIIAGGFDMSVGSTVAFTGILAAMLGQGQYPIFVPLVVAMLGGLAVGIINGVGVSVGNLPPFIMTLGTMTAVRGLALLISDGKPIIGISEAYKAVAASSIFGIPMLAVFLVVIILICSFVLSKTVYGRRVYACGGNLLAAQVSGINTTRIRISTFAIAGLLAGLSGFLMTSRVTIGQPTAAESYEMDAITACVVGGVSMSGGVGKPWGVVVGCLLITVIANGLDIMGVSSHWQKIVKGAIIVLAVLIDVKGKSKKHCQLQGSSPVDPRFLSLLFSQTVRHLNLSAHFCQHHDSGGKPGIHSCCSHCRYRMASNSSNPRHISQIVGGLNQGGCHNRQSKSCQRRKNMSVQ